MGRYWTSRLTARHCRQSTTLWSSRPTRTPRSSPRCSRIWMRQRCAPSPCNLPRDCGAALSPMPPANRLRCQSVKECSAGCSILPALLATRGAPLLPMCHAARSIAARRRLLRRAVRRKSFRPASRCSICRRHWHKAQGGNVRRRRGRQDRAGHGADSRHGRALQGYLGVRRRRRALARRRRDAARHAQFRRSRAHRARLWTDERTAGRALAHAADRADHRSISATNVTRMSF